jgi:hypothetical protein
MRAASFLCCVVLLCLACCHPAPPKHISKVETIPNGWTQDAADRWRNRLLNTGVAESDDVSAMVRAVLWRIPVPSSVATICYLAFGNDDVGRWVDPPSMLIGPVPGLEMMIRPVSELHLAPISRSSGGWVVPWRVTLSGTLISLELRDWSLGSRAEMAVSYYVARRQTQGTAILKKSNGQWVVDGWEVLEY